MRFGVFRPSNAAACLMAE
jgi:hypothetical protein